MEFADRHKLNMLFDFYGVLLTDKQRELFELHYQFDLSLGEIAENFQISRQAVHDLLRRTNGQLYYYEEALQLAEKFFLRQQLLDQLDTAVANENISSAKSIIDRLKNA